MMSTRYVNIFLFILFFIGLPLTVLAHQALSNLTAPPPIPLNPQRVVSLAPSVTETLFALGQGSKVVGVTEYCHFPEEVTKLPVVAGFTDINYEAVLRTRPDLIVLPVDKTASQRELERLGLTTMTLDTRNLTGYMASILSFGQATSSHNLAQKIVSDLENSILKAKHRSQGRTKPRVLFSVMHSYQGFGYITEITAVGQDGFFSNMLELAGGINVYDGPLSFPKLSREAIMTLNPDVIIDLIQGSEQSDLALSDWRGIGPIKAVVYDRIYLFSDESDTVPGPRIYKTIDKLSLALFPSA
ncbi:MAG: helical backbone metal receptor [Deltaproteobacteria bacterium]|jgi:iron complex transport system substrate-binding protein|nr:helical backbone metal receptor [Deltaproteobacteria bacterium]